MESAIGKSRKVVSITILEFPRLYVVDGLRQGELSSATFLVMVMHHILMELKELKGNCNRRQKCRKHEISYKNKQNTNRINRQL